MKKIWITFAILLSINSFAQMVVKRSNGTVITNNQVFPITSLIAPANNVGFFVQNTSNADIRVKIRCESILNATGADFELCFGLCYPSVAAGQRYPGGANAVTVPGNGQTGAGDHFLNNFPGSGVFPLDYVFTFYMVNATGVEIAGTGVTITYRYNPALSTNSLPNDLASLGIDVSKTVTSDFVVIKSAQNCTANRYQWQNGANRNMYCRRKQYGCFATSSWTVFFEFYDRSR